MNYITRESKFFPIILALFAALPPLAINTYAPAISLIAKDFGVPNSAVLTTFATYFVGFSFGMLFWGAISDKYGRKKVIIAGSLIYIASTILCSMSFNFQMLEALRLVQGLADSVGAVISFSIARDCYKGAKLTSMLATIIIILLIAPMVAPIIGSVLVSLTHTWQSTFHFLTAYGVLMVVAALLIEETLEQKDRQKDLSKVIPSYFHHFKNPGFMLGTVASCTLFTPLFIYISSSALIYLDEYKTSITLYCVYYAITCMAAIFANLYIKKYSESIQKLHNIYYTVSAVAISSIVLVIFNFFHIDNALIYTAAMFVLCGSVAFSSTIVYSFSLNQVNDNFGTANAISNFSKNMVAALGSFIVSFYHGRNLIIASPIVQTIFTIITIIVLIIIYKMKIENTERK
ncbi:multidrug effflux MFS transporter [Francisella adeliensis]|uniref:Bcr/CflA family efflux transporter n=1 Tax=Francisella adeliensis TaxID=2007306 RepID=A0A2Z4XXI9_9GAMM|nr:multidrug effflux MFS transporter [Francisella adeliensis]AXA33446.1 Bcr/CflA family drug resistance efflux transporter [Francisella adeliensis]MBK2085466.1 multidrug effflux MFS transporter [Francisella adeliensis]MBK2097196.1 multidrug effflux MFS transporter [Francisella adeliensis]QIW11674.1 multidrug effflux MFS transporter [Francisella adeliensis]QIW13549.1 multidrug effflux MFS transporter [Francisella adeliensis]